MPPRHCCTPSCGFGLWRSGTTSWLAAYALLGLNDITVKATPQQAVEMVRAAEAGTIDEAAIAARLTAMIGADG